MSGPLWLSGAEQIRIPGVTGGNYVCPVGRMIWHTTEGSTVDDALVTYRRTRDIPHLTWDPKTGRIVQHLPANVSATAVKNAPGGVETNRLGALQIEVVAHAVDPFTARAMIGADRIVAFARSHGVPDVWPAGPPLAYGPDPRRPGISPAAYGLANGTRGKWATDEGHYGHSQVAENDHGDPGAIDPLKLTGGHPSTIPPPPKEPTTMPATFPYRGARHVLSVEPDGALMHRFGDVKGITGRESLASGAIPGAVPVVILDDFDPGRIDAYVEKAGGGLVHVWYDGTVWHPEALT